MKPNKVNQSLATDIKPVVRDVLTLSGITPEKCQMVDSFIKLIMELEKHKGKAQTIKDLKVYNSWIQHFCLDQNPEPIPFRKAKNGFPNVLRPWKGFMKGDVSMKRFVISLFRSPEIFRVETNNDTSAITRDPTKLSDEDLGEFKSWLKEWKGLKVLPNKPLDSQIILSNKAGPNGLATAMAFQDLSALKLSPDLYNSVQSLLYKSNLNMNLSDYDTIQSEHIHSKIVFLSDKYGKTRIVAIGDFWSNCALSGIHHTFMYGLRRMETDCTYRQSLVPDLINNLGTNLYSTDLTDATTLFPRKWSKVVIEVKYGSELANLWEEVISNRDFHDKKSKKTVRYKTGTPMGLLSSWSVFAYTHHAFMEWCAEKSKGKSTKYKYIILGDDNIQTEKEVSSLYRKSMVKIGVPLSLSKSTNSESSKAEFAKRLFSNGEEITGIPATTLKHIRKSPELVIDLVRILRERGYGEDELSLGIKALLETFKKKGQLLRILSLPKEISGNAPLKGLITQSNTTEKSVALVTASLEECLDKSRHDFFWEEVSKIAKHVQTGTRPLPIRGHKVHIPENHPALAGIGDKLMFQYLADENEFSIYEQWVEGKSWDLAIVPSIERYRYKDRAHKMSRAKYKILSRTLQYVAGLREFHDEPERPKISNFELFQLGFPVD